MNTNDAESPSLGASMAALHEQILVLGIAVGCSLKATALEDPVKAQAIEDNMRLLLRDIAHDGWNPRSLSLLDILYSALQERSPNA